MAGGGKSFLDFGTTEGFHGRSYVDLWPGEKRYTLSPYFYFSFVTLTTLGDGDITPRTPPAQMLSVYEAIIGQLYLAVLMAMLLGMYLAHRNEKKPDDR